MELELSKDTRIAYFRDPKNHDRVMTVVSKRDESGENLSFAFAINRPTEWKTRAESKTKVEDRLEKGDTWNKKKGLAIALGRLAQKPMTVPLNGRTPKLAILKSLEDNDNGIVQRIVEAELDYMDAVEADPGDFAP